MHDTAFSFDPETLFSSDKSTSPMMVNSAVSGVKSVLRDPMPTLVPSHRLLGVGTSLSFRAVPSVAEQASLWLWCLI